MIKWLVVLACIPALLFSEKSTLKKHFEKLPEHAFFVTKQKNVYTLLHLLERTDSHLYFEEVSISQSSFEKLGLPWRDWIQAKAPQHTHWLLYAWNCSSGRIDEAFAVHLQAWIDPHEMNRFFPTLLSLPMQKLATDERKKIGGNATDFWTPSTIWEGESVSFTQFDEWKGRWPEDQSELSGVTIRCYIPKPNASIPLQIPFWMSFEAKALYQIVTTADAGLHLHSPTPSFPVAPIKLAGKPKVQNAQARITIYPSSKTEHISVTASPVDAPYKRFELPSEVNQQGNSEKELLIRLDELEKGKPYTLHIYDTHNPEARSECQIRR